MNPRILIRSSTLVLTVACLASLAWSRRQATSVPTEVQMPGTQPGEVILPQPGECDQCHGGYDALVEPTHNWRGGMMAQATRDPLFWASVAVAEQDFSGSGDLCLRCHTPNGWLAQRSTPTDGSALLPEDTNGVGCGLCHRLTDPSGLEHVGVQNSPFLANDEEPTPTGYYGSGQYVVWPDDHRLGPYADTSPPHLFLQSEFHRSSDLCGTCHDVSNPVTGDLAPLNGAPVPLAAGTFSGIPGSPIEGKAALQNFPFAYGVVERTYSEHVASLWDDTPVSSYDSLPLELKDGVVEEARLAALVAGTGGNYADGTVRRFTCQTCHMRPTTGKGAQQGSAPTRTDLPEHDMTGGNYWVPEAMAWLDAQDRLVVGGGLDDDELQALTDGALRARHNLTQAAALEIDENEVEIVNLTGHKLISGFPEGRRMWLNVKWYDGQGALLREDGEYGSLTVDLDGVPTAVETILDLDDPNTHIYQAHYGIRQDWAAALVSLGLPTELALEYDRVTGAPAHTLGELAAQPPGTAWESLHFVLNNTVVSDNRIPPYGMSYDEAQERNCLPVPASQFGDPGPGGAYEHSDEVELDPPLGAATAEVRLMYQPTSWEYVRFLSLANNGQVSFLATTGEDLLDAWFATGMAAPEEMASATWTSQEPNVGVPYCGANANSVSPGGALMDASGSGSVAANDLVLACAPLAPGQPGIFFYGPTRSANPIGFPLGEGRQCVVGSLVRILPPAFADGAGTLTKAVDNTLPSGSGIVVGMTQNFQGWYRDPAAGDIDGDGVDEGFNLSNGYTITFVP